MQALNSLSALRLTLARSYDLFYGIGLGTFGFLFDGPSPMPSRDATTGKAEERARAVPPHPGLPALVHSGRSQ